MLLLSFSVTYADTTKEEEIFQFRLYLRDKQFKKADDMLSQFNTNEMDEPKLELLETELWIEKAEDFYKRRQYKSAFPLYKDAYARWRTNPLIKERYTSLSNKILFDEKPSSVLNTSPILDDTSHDELDDFGETIAFLNAERIDVLDNRVWILTLISAFSLSLNLIVIAVLFSWSKQR